METRLRRILQQRPLLAFLLMGASFVLFGLATLNLVSLLRANIALFLDYGIMVVADGALRQLVELLAYGYVGLACYLVFKTCEHILVERLMASRRDFEYRD